MTQIAAIETFTSSTDFTLDLYPTLCCKTHSISCLRGNRFASHKKPHSLSVTSSFGEGFPCKQGVILCRNISLFHMTPLLLADPRLVREDDQCFREADNHPIGPHMAACYFLHISACCGFLFGFLHRLDSLASPNYFLTDVGMFCYLK